MIVATKQSGSHIDSPIEEVADALHRRGGDLLPPPL
jgi:hypothetical protein